MHSVKEAALQTRNVFSNNQLDRILQDYSKQGRVGSLSFDGELSPLQAFVEAEARELPSAAFALFMQELYTAIDRLVVTSPSGKEADERSRTERRMAAVIAINELIDTKIVGEQTFKINRFGRALQEVLGMAHDSATLELAAATLGHLVLSGGAVTADLVGSEVRRALHWLAAKERVQQQRLAAALVLKELAAASPAVFNMHVRQFIEVIWAGIRDLALPVRIASVQALQACLVLVEKRETRYRVQWYYRLFEETRLGLQMAQPLDRSHGCLLALGELLAHTGEFMLARYREVVDAVLSYRASKADNRDHLLRRAAIDLIPRLAAFAPERFASSYLTTCAEFLLGSLKPQDMSEPAIKERAQAFQALGDLANALAAVGCAAELHSFLPRIAEQVRLAIASATATPRLPRVMAARGAPASAVAAAAPCPKALQVVGALAQALGAAWRPYVEQLLEPMALTGISQELVLAMQEVVRQLPELSGQVQVQLLNLLSQAIRGVPFHMCRKSYSRRLREAVQANKDAAGDEAVVRLALKTLGEVSLGPLDKLLAFVNEHVAPLMATGDTIGLRRAAALAAARVLRRHAAAQMPKSPQLSLLADTATPAHLAVSGPLLTPNLPPPPPPPAPASPAVTHLVEKVVRQLLAAVVGDASAVLRRQVLSALCDTPALEHYLAQPDNLRALFIALNDEAVAVRVRAIQAVGRLAAHNPAYVMPALRKHLMQLLSDMSQAPESRQREESASLLEMLICACPPLVLPYVPPILRALVAKLRAAVNQQQQAHHVATGGSTHGPPAGRSAWQPQGYSLAPAGSGALMGPLGSGGGTGAAEGGVIASVLATTGALARVAGPLLRPHVNDIVPLIIDALQDPGEGPKRHVAVLTLGQVVESTGIVIAPYNEFPSLLSFLLQMLSDGTPALRLAVLKVLGIIGALDPHTHKTNQADLQGEGKLEAEGVRPQRYGAPPALGGEQGARTIGATAAAAGREDLVADVLPASALGTSSEDYYPTVAINALMRLLRDPSMSSHQQAITQALFEIFRTLGLACVPYLPKVVPTMLLMLQNGDTDAVPHLTALVRQLRQHFQRWLPDLIQLVQSLWPHPVTAVGQQPGKLLLNLLDLLACLAEALRDDMRSYLPELLPRFSALVAEAERSSNYSPVRPALKALEALGSALEEHLQLMLPLLVRLTAPGSSSAAGPAVPLDVRRAALATCRRLLSRMALTSCSSAVVHPLLRVLTDSSETLRKDAADTICALALALGPDLALFAPAIRKAAAQGGLQHERLQRLLDHFQSSVPPCMSEAADWESVDGWLYDLVPEYEAMALPGIADANGGQQRYVVDMGALQRAWESSQRSTKDDWDEWMRHFAVVLLKESPSPALRSTCDLAMVQPGMARELFPAGFVSCWAELDVEGQEALVRSLEAALASPSIPPDLITTLLNLAEFMEHDDKSLPLDTRTLGALAEKCHAFAKALHYREIEFTTHPENAVEALISINNHLRLPEAADGILAYAQQTLHMELKESWYEKLNRWDEALEAYERKYTASRPGTPAHIEASLGRCRCLASLAEWERLSVLVRKEWRRQESSAQRELAPLAAHAAWHMGHWEEMGTFVDALKTLERPATSEVAFLQAVLHVRRDNHAAAREMVGKARVLLGAEMAALVGESYERAYGGMVRAQQLTELEEAVDYAMALTLSNGDEAAAEARRRLVRDMWWGRLRGVQRNVEVWQALLSVRHLVLPPELDRSTTIKFASLCRKFGRVRQSQRTLLQLLHYDPLTRQQGEAGYGAGSGKPDVMFGFLKHVWATGDRHDAFQRLVSLVQEVEEAAASDSQQGKPLAWEEGYSAPLYARTYMRLGMWKWTITSSEELGEGVVGAVLDSLARATEAAPGWAKAWHNWALYNVSTMEHYAHYDVQAAQRHVAPAVLGFFRSVALAQAQGKAVRGSNLQDILRLLTLWFNHGRSPDVEAALQEGFSVVSIDTWLMVIPQIIARIHTNQPRVRRLIHALLVRVGRHHPQALMYPLLVAVSSSSPNRRAAATAVVDAVRQHSATLVEQAELVSTELIRMAILWHEQWHEALEEASRLYFGDSNVAGMLAILSPLHRRMRENGPNTLKEIAFVQNYGRELNEAYECTQKYRQSRREAELHQAWDMYYHVFKRINKQLPTLTVLDLQYVAPALVRAQNLELAVPGTYLAGEPVVTISAFAPQLHVITSKQRPRKLTIHGSDGAEYMFLLKGHEDLRQDERVMQLFGLVNSMLAHDRTTAERDLSIARYAVIPLSPNSGLIGWVPNTDTLHALIREYRDARKIPLNVEHRLMLGMAPDYDHLPLINKVEVFQHALDSTSGDDLHNVLWLKSRSSEVWLDRRTTYTRSTAVLSVVGYLLGLGDRHPSNLMLDRYSGKLLHIDFGDCFEASMHREKFPERVPFRLTRMMVRAFEVSGIEGNFRHTCESVMRVLRSNKDSVMAMLEAFVHDPLINWRLLNTPEAAPDANPVHEHPDIPSGPPLLGGHPPAGSSFWSEELRSGAGLGTGGPGIGSPRGGGSGAIPSPPRRDARERELIAAYGQLNDATETLNERAVAVMKRMSDKLTGRDFSQEGGSESDSVAGQVVRLIQQATSHENLCQSYIGWCPFW